MKHYQLAGQDTPANLFGACSSERDETTYMSGLHNIHTLGSAGTTLPETAVPRLCRGLMAILITSWLTGLFHAIDTDR